MKKYSVKDLKLIAETLNVLLEESDNTSGAQINIFHASRFYNDTSYIDYSKRFKVYKKYKGWKPLNEIFV